MPTSVYNLQQVLERFNTLEQPRIEEMMDSANDGLEELDEILGEVKRLFVQRSWKAVTLQELSTEKRKELGALEASLDKYDQLIDKNRELSTQLQSALVKAQPTKLQIPKMIGFKPHSEAEGTNPGNSGTPGNPGNPQDPGNPVNTDNGDDPGPGDGYVASGPRGISSATVDGSVLHAVMHSGPSLALKGKVSAMAMQPMAASIATGMNHNAVSAYLDNYHAVQGRVRYYQRQKLKIEKKIYRIKWIPVDEPGVIPRTLEEVRQIVERFRAESQPRLETLLDTVNSTVAESRSMLTNINTSLEKTGGVLDFLNRHSLLVKIGLGITAGLAISILVLLLIVLIRLALTI